MNANALKAVIFRINDWALKNAEPLIAGLKENGIKVGGISLPRSKDYRRLLQDSPLKEHFDVIIDSREDRGLGLMEEPKFHQEALIKASCYLGAVPADTAVIENSTPRIKDARNCGFGLVAGLTREGNEAEFFKLGADVVLKDFEDMDLQWVNKWFERTPAYLFSFWDNPPYKEQVDFGPNNVALNPHYLRKGSSIFAQDRRIVFFLDYDGTLTPIVNRPEEAIISEQMRRTIRELAKVCTVAVVSGRMRQDVEKLAQIEGIFYAGSHGFDIKGPQFSFILPQAKEVVDIVADLVKELKKKLGSIDGVLIEEKKFSVAVHYRLADQKHVPRIKLLLEDIIENNLSLRLMEGKKVFEILPAFEWNKGKAVQAIMDTLKIRWNDSSVVYIGDDTTDEDAFRAVRTRGAGILVASENKPSTADFRLSSPQEVKKLFETILNRSK